jgi:GDP-L-fucose synthase
LTKDISFFLNKKIFVAGHTGMVGSALVRRLSLIPKCELVLARSDTLNLENQRAVNQFLEIERPDIVVIAAAKVGGIQANQEFPAEFIYKNLMIQSNIIHGSFLTGVRHLLFLGSSCIYPKHARQPMVEEELLSGFLEPTNEPYAIAKIAGIKMCESYNRQYTDSHGLVYKSVMPTNLFGPGDNFHSENSHVIPGLIRRFHEAKASGLDRVVVWGSGRPRREFLYVDDLIEACLIVLSTPSEVFREKGLASLSHINVGSGIDIEISELAQKIGSVVGFEGNIVYDTSRADGTPRKLLDSSRMRSLGWEPITDFRLGLTAAYQSFLSSL